MKKTLLLFLIAAVCSSCKNDIKAADIRLLNGYWEITQTVSAKGLKKDFKINETIDYFEIKGQKGFRKKVMPQFDGHYIVNDQEEDLEIRKINTRVYICYTTPYGKWKDEILALTADELVLADQHGMQYHYKKPEAFSVK